MELLIDCKKVNISHGEYGNTVTVRIDLEERTKEQLEHYIDYLYDTYGSEFVDKIITRFDLLEKDYVHDHFLPREE